MLSGDDNIKGFKNFKKANHLQEKHGEEVGIFSIGPASVIRLSAAIVAVTDTKGNPCCQAACGGMEAVMGSKGVKAIVVYGSRASGITYHYKDSFKKAAEVYRKIIMENPMAKPKDGVMALQGTDWIVNPIIDIDR